MIKMFMQPFMPASIHSKIDRFFELYKVTFAFAIYCIPWWLVNQFFKFSLLTSPLYGLCVLILIPNVVVMLHQFGQVYLEGHSFTLKEDMATFAQRWRAFRQLRWGFNAVVTIIGMGFTFEFLLVMRQEVLHFMIIPFLIIGAFLMATLWNYLLVTAIDKSGENLHEQLKKSVYLGWRSIFGALTIGLLLSLWLSVGYQATILNILGMNIVVFWIGYKLTIKAVQRTINPVQAGLENK